ncbi:MAG: hypothetical protein WC959_05020 [Kiritimatiellales bacterium]
MNPQQTAGQTGTSAPRRVPVAWIAAGILAAGWFVFWLTAFTPELPETPVPEMYPHLAFKNSGDEIIRELLRPDVFALPFRKGYSDSFPPRRVDLRLTLEHPRSPECYLPLSQEHE